MLLVFGGTLFSQTYGGFLQILSTFAAAEESSLKKKKKKLK